MIGEGAFSADDAVQGVGARDVIVLSTDAHLAPARLRGQPASLEISLAHCTDKSVIEIVESVFEAYLPLAIWRWSDEAGTFMDGALPRSYCCEYRESDLDFVQRSQLRLQIQAGGGREYAVALAERQ